jgi:hypothetical protein
VTHILVMTEFPPDVLEKIRQAAQGITVHYYPAGEWAEIPAEVLAQTEVLYAGSDLPAPGQLGALKWVQSHSAGVDHWLRHPLFIPVDGQPQAEVQLTTASGVHAVNMSEFILMMMLGLAPDGLSFTNLCISIIGGDPSKQGQLENGEMARLHDLRNELGLNDLVTFLGARDQDTLQFYYSAADCLVMPSHYESFGMVALEAMACGTPVVVSDVGGLSQLVRHNVTGIRVRVKDPTAMADAIQRLLTNEVLRRRMGARAACYAEDYSWSKIVDKLIKVYEELK